MIADHQHPAIVADHIDRAAATGRDFTAEDIRRQLPDETRAWIAANHSRLGNCLLSAKQRKIIHRTGWTTANRTTRHRSACAIWRGTEA